MCPLLSFRHSWRQPLYYSRVWQLVGLLCIWMAYLREVWLSVAVACNVSNASLSATRGICHRGCVCPHNRKSYAPSLMECWPGQYECNFPERLSVPIIAKGWIIVCQRSRLTLFWCWNAPTQLVTKWASSTAAAGRHTGPVSSCPPRATGRGVDCTTGSGLQARAKVSQILTWSPWLITVVACSAVQFHGGFQINCTSDHISPFFSPLSRSFLAQAGFNLPLPVPSCGSQSLVTFVFVQIH